MLIEVKVKNTRSIVRRNPNPTAEAINSKSPSDTIYNATNLFNGWYFIEELVGWIQSIDIAVVKVIEPYDPKKDGISFDTDCGGTNQGSIGNISSVKELVDLINKSVGAYIDSSKVSYTDKDGTTKIPIKTLIDKLSQGLTDIEEALTKIDSLVSIPKVPDPYTSGYVLTIDDAGNIAWLKPSGGSSGGTGADPTEDPNYSNDF